MSDSSGVLVIENDEYPINAGFSYSFREGLNHYTKNAGETERLIIGPLSEKGFAVGSVGIFYCSDSIDNITSFNIISTLISIRGRILFVRERDSS